MRISADKRGRSAFTMVEVLAAMMFMAIVIPAAVEGLRVASRAGVVAQRKAVAARIGDRLLNDALLANQFSQSVQPGMGNVPVQSGVEQYGPIQYRWTMRSEPWNQSAMNDNGVTPVSPEQTSFNQTGGNATSATTPGTSPVVISDVAIFQQLTVEVTYPVQNRNFSVKLSTLLVDLSK
jgi:type II secretory pathway pseudopilin PulG